MAHLGMAVLELKGWVTKVISGQENDASKVNSRENQISFSYILAVQRKRIRLLRSSQA
jgi:hypothetical protein